MIASSFAPGPSMVRFAVFTIGVNPLRTIVPVTAKSIVSPGAASARA